MSRDLADAESNLISFSPVDVAISPPPEGNNRANGLFIGTVIGEGAQPWIQRRPFRWRRFSLADQAGGFEEGLRRRCLEQNVLMFVFWDPSRSDGRHHAAGDISLASRLRVSQR